MAKHSLITFPCDECDYRAAQKGSLRNHKRAMHNGERYPCGEPDAAGKYKLFNLIKRLLALILSCWQFFVNG
jgi:hypothetical protein